VGVMLLLLGYLIQYIVFLVLGLCENRILDGIDGHTFDPACGIFRYYWY
jgi:hypothetical protein